MSWRARFVIWVLVALGLLSIAMSFATAAESVRPAPPADPNCGQRDNVLWRLKLTFNELPIFRGAASAGNSIVLTMNSKGEWTLLACDTAQCCVRAAGNNATFLPGA